MNFRVLFCFLFFLSHLSYSRTITEREYFESRGLAGQFFAAPYLDDDDESLSPIDYVKKHIRGAGVVGEVHGMNTETGHCVFTYRKRNFFEYIHLAMFSRNPEVAVELNSLSRHDVVRIRGELNTHSGQSHVKLSGIELIKKFQPSPALPPYNRQADFPAELKAEGDSLFLVHAVHAKGRKVVLEYRDSIIPLEVGRSQVEHSRDLFRGDLIRVHYQFDVSDDRPPHLSLNDDVEKPIEMIESIKEINEERVEEMEGELVLFPKSPQINFNIFALYQDLGEGRQRTFTLLNFEDFELFQKIREKLQKAWDEAPEKWVNARNKLKHLRLRVKASGRYNLVSPAQANPQILIDSLDDVEVFLQ